MTTDVIHMVREALLMLEGDQPDRAVWRLVDAAGMLGKVHHGSGWSEPTGRFFQVVEVRPTSIRYDENEVTTLYTRMMQDKP